MQNIHEKLSNTCKQINALQRDRVLCWVQT